MHPQHRGKNTQFHQILHLEMSILCANLFVNVQIYIFTLAQRRLTGDVVVNGPERNEPYEVHTWQENKRKVKKRSGDEKATADSVRRHFKND